MSARRRDADQRRRAHAATANLLLSGDGTPRSKEQILAAIVAALEAAHEDGRAAGASEARGAALREVAAMLAGIRLDVEHRQRLVDRELSGE